MINLLIIILCGLGLILTTVLLFITQLLLFIAACTMHMLVKLFTSTSKAHKRYQLIFKGKSK